MAKPRPTITKRLREKARHEKRRRKEEKRLEREAEKAAEQAELAELPEHVDPDIAHIQPGPQPIPEWMRDGEEAG